MKKKIIASLMCVALSVSMVVPVLANEIVEENIVIDEDSILVEEASEEAVEVSEDSIIVEEVSEEATLDDFSAEAVIGDETEASYEDVIVESVGVPISSGRITWGQNYATIISNTKDGLLYDLPLTESGRVKITWSYEKLQHGAYECGYFIKISDDAGNTVWYKKYFGDGKHSGIDNIDLVAGNYTVYVYPSYGGESWPFKYDVNFTMNYESAKETVRDSLSNKHDDYNIPIAYSGSSMRGLIAWNDRTDVFKYKALKDQVAGITIKTTDLRGAYDFKLVSSSTGETLLEEKNIASGTRKFKNIPLKKGSYYVTISSTTKTGKYTLAINGVNVKKNSISKLNKVNKNKIKIAWTKLTCADEYQVTVSTNKKFTSGSKTYKTASASCSAPVQPGKTYYVRVRAKFTCGSKTFYSPWSKTKTIKIKK